VVFYDNFFARFSIIITVVTSVVVMAILMVRTKIRGLLPGFIKAVTGIIIPIVPIWFGIPKYGISPYISEFSTERAIILSVHRGKWKGNLRTFSCQPVFL
jgi:hypothetical protein